ELNTAVLSTGAGSAFETIQASTTATASLLDALTNTSLQDVSSAAATAHKKCLAAATRTDILHQFLVAIEMSSLQSIRAGVLQCRRALLSASHRREFGQQHITVGELRSYLLLVSTKLPVLRNIALYLREAEQNIEDPALQDSLVPLRRQ